MRNGPLKEFSADLHIHTVLFPLCEVEMISPIDYQSPGVGPEYPGGHRP